MNLSPSTIRKSGFVAVVVALVALGGVATARVAPPRAGTPQAAAARAVAEFTGATSTLWSCAGPLPVGSTTVKSSIELTNAGKAPIQVEIHFALSSGRSAGQRLTVAPGALVVARPPAGSFGLAAASVVADGRGLSVVELVHGSSGPVAAPCAASTGTTEYLVAGDTRGTDEVDVALFDPSSTPAVASLSFATASGRQTPPSFQGVPVPAGGLVVLSVADRLPFQQELGVTVRASGGALAVGALDVARVGQQSVEALENGAAWASTHWQFSAAPAGPAAAQTIDLLNPSGRTAKVDLGFLSPTPTARVALSVPAGGVARVVLPSETTSRALGAPVVTVTNGVPVVAGRELRIEAVISPALLPERNPTLRARRALLLVPRIPLAYSVSSGVVTARRTWVLGGGENGSKAAELVEVTNPTRKQATVSIAPVGDKTPWVRAFAVGPMSSQTVDLADLSQVTGRFALILTASTPVVASGALYAKGLVGFTSPVALPAD